MNFLFPEWEDANEVLSDMVDTFFETDVVYDMKDGSIDIHTLKIPVDKIPSQYKETVLSAITYVLNKNAPDGNFGDAFQMAVTNRISEYVYDRLDEKTIREIREDVKGLIVQKSCNDIDSLKCLLRERFALDREEK